MNSLGVKLQESSKYKHFIFYAFFLLFSMLITLWAYYPSFSGGFLFDDYANIVNNIELTKNQSDPRLGNLWQGAWSSDSGPLGRPVAMLSFAIQIAVTGLDPYPMKIFNFFIHWLTGIVIFFISLQLIKNLEKYKNFFFEKNWIAAGISLIWLLHPLHLTSVSYIVQRMNSLSGLFVSLAILFYLHLRSLKKTTKWSKEILILLIFTSGLLGLLAKENAILLPIYLLVIEVFIFRNHTSLKEDPVLKSIFFAALLSLIAVFFIAIATTYLNAYEYREFDIGQRLLTQSRVVTWYLLMLIIPDISQMTLYHDNIEISTSLLRPFSTLTSVFLLLILITISLLARKKYSWVGFGICWFLGGHLLESTILPLELAYEHRNYLPSFGIFFFLVVTADSLISRIQNSFFKNKLIPMLFLSLIILLGSATHSRSYVWSGSPEFAIIHANNHSNSVRANIDAGIAYAFLAKNTTDPKEKLNLIKESELFFKKALELKPGSPNPLFLWAFLYFENEMTPPSHVIYRLRKNLSNGLIDATTVNGLDNLTKCLKDNICKLNDEEYLSLIYSVLENEGIADLFSSIILRSLSSFYEFKEDYNKSIIFTKRAIELNAKNLVIRLELVRYLINGGYLELASKELNDLEKKDILNRYYLIISEWRQKINEYNQQ